MADRTLKRPMFRRGGSANEGIMTGLVDRSVSADTTSGGLNSLIRPGYAEGDVVEPANTQAYRDYVEELLYPSNIIGDTSRLLGNITDTAYNWTARPLGNLAQYMLPIADWKPIDKKDSQTENIERYMESQGVDLGEGEVEDKEIIDLSKTENIPDGADPKDGRTQGKNESGDMSESDLKTVYADLLPMFKETLGVDDSEFTRDKYLELAKFGTNLMAQPGGSLTRAIGKAAEQPLEGLSRIAETKRKAKKVPAEIAMKIALQETESGPVGKQIRDLKKVYPQRQGETVAEWNKRIGDKVLERGTATREQTSESRVQNNIKLLLDSQVFDKDYMAGIVGRAIGNTGLDISYFAEWPKDKADLIDGQHYFTKDGKLKLVKDKKVLTWNPKTSKFE